MTEERLQDVIIFTLGSLMELQLKGLVERTGDTERLTGKGMDEFIRLKNNGFNASEEEIRAAMTLFAQYPGDSQESLDIQPGSPQTNQ